MPATGVEGKSALVTGSTRGVGEGIAHVLAADGARVVVTGRSQEDGARVVKDIGNAGGTAEYVHLDMADADSVRRAVADSVRLFGGIDVLVNNAAPTDLLGIGGADNTLVDLDPRDWRRILTPALDGFFWVSKAAIAEMVAAGRGGSVINISSGAGVQGTTGISAYTASKGAIQALTRSMAVEYAAQGIRANCLVLGPILTPSLERLIANPEIEQAFTALTAVGRLGTPTDVGNAVSFLASDRSSFITGTEFTVDGGMVCRMAVPNIAS